MNTNEPIQIGFTALKALSINVAEFLACIHGEFQPTPAMELGTAVHDMLAYGEYDFGEVLPAGSRRPAGSSSWKQDGVDRVHAIVNRVISLGFRPEGDVEPEIFFDVGKYRLRAKPDVLDRKNKIIYDYKTIGIYPLTERKITNTIADSLYHVQLAYYSMVIKEAEGWSPEQWCIIAICTGESRNARDYIDCKRVFLDPAWIASGEEILGEWIAKLRVAEEQEFKENVDELTIYNLPKPKYI